MKTRNLENIEKREYFAKSIQVVFMGGEKRKGKGLR